MPACWASAGVGHCVPHQRRARRASRSGDRARAGPGDRAPGRCPDSARVLAGALDASSASTACASTSSSGANRRAAPGSRACRSRAPIPAGTVAAVARRRASAPPDAARSPTARRVSRRHQHLLARSPTSRHQSHSNAAKRLGVGHHGASARGSCSHVLAQRLAHELRARHAEAIRYRPVAPSGA